MRRSSSSLALLLVLAGCAHPAAPASPSSAAVVVAPLPPQATAVLLSGAADIDVDTRRLALAALLRTADVEAWAPRARFDPSPYVQRALIAAVSPRPELHPTLPALARDRRVDGFTRGLAATAWLRHEPAVLPEVAALAGAERDDDAVGLLLAAAADPPSLARLTTWLQAGDLPLEPGFVAACGASPAVRPALLAALPRVEPELRLTVAAALLGEPAADDALRAGLHDPVVETRLEALDLLETRADAAPLLRDARLSLDRLVRTRAELALIGLGQLSATPLAAALDDEDREIRLAAIRAAGRLPELPARLLSDLYELTRSDDPATQVEAVHALRPDRDRAALLALLDDESLRVRVYAVDRLLGG